MASTTNRAILEESKAEIARHYPSFGNELFAFLERDESSICFARKWQRHLSAMRIQPSPAIAANSTHLEIRSERNSVGNESRAKKKKKNRVLRHLEPLLK